MQVTLPIKLPFILHGRGALGHLKSFPEKNILIVTDAIGRKLFGAKLLDELGGKEVTFFDEVEPNPKLSIMNRAGELARSIQPQLIIGIGGGSALDTAKAAYFLCGQPAMKLTEMQYYVDYGLAKKSKLVQIPTTSGTGAESSAGCVFTVDSTGVKIDVLSADLIPAAIIVDPELTLSMPRSLTIATGVDAIVQAIESSSSIFISDILLGLNLSAIKTIYKYLPLAAGEGAGDIAVREKMHYAATTVGMAMGSTSLVIGHACGHAIGALYNYPHGITVATMLPYCIEFNRGVRKAIYNEILESCFNISGAADPAAKLSSMMKDFFTNLGVATSVKELGIDREDWEGNLDTMTKIAAADTFIRTSPRPATQEDFKKIFQYAYEGKSIDF